MASRLVRADRVPAGMDPIIGARDPVAIYRSEAPVVPHHPRILIPLPDKLRTGEEMVAWMARELSTLR